MRLLLDANVVLDVLLDRQPFAAEAREVWAAADRGLIDGCIAAFTLPTVHYICRRQDSIGAADLAVKFCLAAFDVAALYPESIAAAQRMPGRDFEDNLQIACALSDFAEGIVTRNPQDFAASPIRVYTPVELLALLRR